jgi:hypothetical protein
MSRGLGAVQRAVLELIASKAEGAWRTQDICEHVYGASEKRHRVAVLRAIKRMTLPEGWEFGWAEDAGGCLYRPCSDKSQIERARLRRWLLHVTPKKFKDSYRHLYDRAIEAAQKARAWRDASPIERIDIQIEQQRAIVALWSVGGGGVSDYVRQYVERIAELEAEKEKLRGQSGAKSTQNMQNPRGITSFQTGQ